MGRNHGCISNSIGNFIISAHALDTNITSGGRRHTTFLWRILSMMDLQRFILGEFLQSPKFYLIF
jgi:hypothetical protein